MREEDVLELPVNPTAISPNQPAGITGIRYLFHEMHKQNLYHNPSSYYGSIKRFIDVTIALTFIVTVMSWLTPLIALLIKLTSKGPVFFIQKRTGYLGVEFNCFKFRSMVVNNEAHTRQVCKDDKRITTIGKFLRATHIDETPQFFNVLLGDMSIVGPRPHMTYHTRKYAERIPYYHLRLEVLPGMTGMAQVKDYIGEISEDRELRKRIQWDIFYVKHRSIGLDVKIIFSTFGKVMKKMFSFI